LRQKGSTPQGVEFFFKPITLVSGCQQLPFYQTAVQYITQSKYSVVRQFKEMQIAILLRSFVAAAMWKHSLGFFHSNKCSMEQRRL
jgi:hypothetical protein